MPASVDVNKRQTDFAHLHPVVRSAVKKVLSDLEEANIPFRAFEMYRSPRRQRWLFAQGRTRPGQVVTWVEAWSSFHQYGLAVDFVLFRNNDWSWDDSGPEAAWWTRLHEIGARHGLRPISKEKPHLQFAGCEIGDLKAGRYPAGGDRSWAENLEATIIDWGSGAPRAPDILPARPSLEGGVLIGEEGQMFAGSAVADGFDADSTRPVMAPRPPGTILTDIGLILPFIEKWEGGYVDHTHDRGGPTNMGVTLETLAAWRGRPVTAADVRALGRAEARLILTKRYFAPVRAGEMPPPVALFAYNISVLSGPRRAVEMAQAALVDIGIPVEQDGVIGDETVGGVLRAEPGRLADAISDRYEAYLRALPDFVHFGRGWMNRLNDARGFADRLASGGTQPAPERKERPMPELPVEGDLFRPAPMPAPNPAPSPQPAPLPGTGQAAEVVAAFEAFIAALRGSRPPGPDGERPVAPADMLSKLRDAITAVEGGSGLGPVNGALGQTIGNLLNGYKSTAGILGTMLTGMLSPTVAAKAEGAAVVIRPELVKLMPALEPLMAVSPTLQPIFIALTIWGALGKAEKWLQPRL
jgi:peptidoglycan L-alanyl-D-glutamate endopeptidase CwlK